MTISLGILYKKVRQRPEATISTVIRPRNTFNKYIQTIGNNKFCFYLSTNLGCERIEGETDVAGINFNFTSL